MLDNHTYKKLKHIVGAQNATREKEDVVCYGYDATARSYLPDAVVFPQTSAEVAAVMKLANQMRIPVIPRGYGSGMTGGALAVNGGIIMAMTRMNRIIDIDTDNLVARVEPGVVTKAFHQAVERQGLFYPPDPSSSAFSTLGGNLAECAGGPRAVKYGVTRDYVLGLEAVLPEGDIIHTGVQTAKGVVGYDMTRLLIGSEGTLGIITGIILRLLPLPEAVFTMLAVFHEMDDAARVVSEIIRRRIVPRTIEFLDQASVRCAESWLKKGLPVDAGAVLILEVDGSYSEAGRAIRQLAEICNELGARETDIAKDAAEAENIWQVRKAISPALFQYGPHKINEDIVVPRSKIPDLVRKVNALQAETGLTMVSFGHAGDGNIHFNIMLDKSDVNELRKAEKAVDTLFDYTLALGGTISGEHGVGITKQPYIAKEIGPVELALMRKIKAVFDPNDILNPGKIFGPV